MSGLADHKPDLSAETGANLGAKHNSLIDAILTAFDIVSTVLTFSVTPKCSNVPSDDAHLANKKYVDDKVGAVVMPAFGDYESKSANTIYQADTDGFVVAYLSLNGALNGYTDASSSPSTLVNHFYSSSSEIQGNICFPVKKGNYWRVEMPGGGYVRFMPIA